MCSKKSATPKIDMKLVNRVSAFFLVALALALVAYSAAFYFLARNYLNRQFDDDLHSALQILAASVEVEPDDVKWHPAEHGIDLNQQILSEVIWVVCDERGQTVDRSPRASRTEAALAPVLEYAQSVHTEAFAPFELGEWRVMQTELSAPAPKSLAIREAHEYARLYITVARSRKDLDSVLNRLGLLVTILPAVVWLAAAGIGRWLVRHALQPVREMADRARSMTQADFDLRLPISSSNDELAELASTFNQLLDQLQTAFDRQRQFTGDAAHQLRTPLAVLQGQLDVALRRPRGTAEYQQTLNLLSDQTAELRQIIESLLFLARSEADATVENCEVIALDDWLAEYARHWADHPRSRDLVVQSSSATQVKFSRPLLTQLLDNLVGNALTYSQPDSAVVITTQKTGDHVTIAVKDHGIGIAIEDQNAVFEPFFRADEARRAGIAGTGLGLSVAARIAAALGGELTCVSVPGRGSTFTLTLPVGSHAKAPNAVRQLRVEDEADFRFPSSAS
jgi:heavy metal sensor kinase